MTRGYPIGNHGYDSLELTSCSDEEMADDIRRATAAIEEAIGRPIDRYFTPFASAIDERTRAIVAAEGYLPVAWEVYTADFSPEATEQSVYDRVMEGAHDGAIVELHLDAANSAASTGRALPRVIADLRAQGYRFVTIPEMAHPRPCWLRGFPAPALTFAGLLIANVVCLLVAPSPAVVECAGWT